jgi:tetratricopeptide (TPR) repeat protein
MKINWKVIITLSGSIILLTVITLLIWFILNNSYRKKLPPLPDLHATPSLVKKQLSSAFNTAHHKPTADNMGKLGMAYHSSAYYEKAALCYKLAVKKNKSKWLWSYYLGYLNREMGETTDVIKNFRRVNRKNPEINLAVYYLGEAYNNLRLTDKAEEAFGKIAKVQDTRAPVKTMIRNDHFPLQVYAMYKLARIYSETNRLDLAEITLRRIIQNHLTFGPAYQLLGNVYGLRGDSSLSEYYTVRSNDLTDFSPPVDTIADKLAIMSRSEEYLLKQIDDANKSGYSDWALQLLNNARLYIPENKYLLSKAIKFYLNMGIGIQALPYLNQHLKYFVNNFDELKEIADLLMKKGFYPQSLLYYYRLVKIKPEETNVQCNMALCLWNEGMKHQAFGMMNRLLEKNKNNTKVLSNAIYFMLMVGEKNRALSYLSKLKQLSPLNSDVPKWTGTIAEKEGNMQKAIAMYKLAFKSNPEDMATIKFLGNILRQQKMWDESISFFRQALEYHPNEPYLLEGLGTLLVSYPDEKLRDYQQGKEFSERAFLNINSSAETKISAGVSLVEAYVALGDNQNAYIFMTATLNMAQRLNTPIEILEDLKNRLAKLTNPK